MRRFVISSPKFQGEAEVLYNDEGVLCQIDLTNAVMDAVIVSHFKQAVPPTFARLEAGEGFGGNTTIVEADIEVSFEKFWKAYDKKINKIRAEKVWNSLSKSEQVQAFYGIKPYDKFLKTQEKWRAKADPETYLRNKMWQNEWKK